MELLLEFVIEFFFEIIVDSGLELQHNERIPKWIRVTLAVFTVLFFTVVIVGCIVLGALILKDTLLGGIVLIFLGVIMLLCAIRKIVKVKKHQLD